MDPLHIANKSRIARIAGLSRKTTSPTRTTTSTTSSFGMSAPKGMSGTHAVRRMSAITNTISV